MEQYTALDQRNDSIRLTAALAVRPQRIQSNAMPLIGVLPGEGIGPEVIGATLAVLERIGRHAGIDFEVRTGSPIGLEAQRQQGSALTPAVTDFCESIFSRSGALLCGPGGGRFVYDLRSHFDLFCKLTPLHPFASLADTGVLKARAREAADILMVRENTGGVYFGEWGRTKGTDGEDTAYQHCGYHRGEIRRILQVAIALSQMRSRRLCLVIKLGGIPAISGLWRETLDALVTGSGLTTRILEIDYVAYQLIAGARDFDVIVSPNLFGDVLADCGALLLGSRGLSYSANFNGDGAAVYQTGHGAAHDLAGTDRANPIGQILSLGMLLRESFALFDIAGAIDAALEDVLKGGWRTPDIASAGSRTIGTGAMGRRVADAVAAQLR